MSQFITRWHEVSETQHSLIVAGCDPAHSGMRGSDCLPEGVSMHDWCMEYLSAVSPHVAAIKCNPAYYQSEEGIRTLKEISDFTRAKGLISIIDCKASDIGATNDAWFKGYADMGFDAVTIAPYAGNIEGSIKDAHDRGLGAITMGLMSNPEYASEMHMKEGNESLALQRVTRSLVAGADAVVVGATYAADNHYLKEVVEKTKNSTMLFLVPGIGAQGGTIENVFGYGIPAPRLMLSISRGLMFPKGVVSTAADQREAAKRFQLQSQF